MNRYLIKVCFIFFSGFLSAQVGIQTSQVSPSAALEINTSDLATGSL